MKELKDARERMLIDPNLKLDVKTQKHRDSCSKKRKYGEMMDLAFSAPLISSSHIPSLTTNPNSRTEEEDKVLNSLLEAFCSHKNIFED